MIKTLLTTACRPLARRFQTARLLDLQAANTIAVTPDNFPRAESDLYFGNIARDDGFGKFQAPPRTKFRSRTSWLSGQTGTRSIRPPSSTSIPDPVTINLPDAGKRFMSMQIINEDQLHATGRL